MSQKEVIYIDVEDDITSIIDKATKPKANIIALVLPKKTSALKSSVNMKLLKNSTDKAKKKMVLITTESALLPLAGAAGVHVAENLKSRPAVPKKPAKKTNEDVVDSEEPQLDPNSEIGDLTDEVGDKSDTASTKSEKIKKIKKSSKIKVPNFDRFRIRIILAVLAVIGLVVGWYVMFNVMPRAEIAIQAETSRVPTNTNFTLNTTVDELNLERKVIPGKVNEIKKTLTERFDATGEKDVGKKAKGTITVQNCDTSDSFTLASGTEFTDTNTGFIYISNESADVPGGSFSGGGCSAPGEVDVAVTAETGGDNRNLSPRSYAVAGVGSLITGFGGQMSGGTSEIKKVVSAEDISSAQQELLNKTDENVRSELTALFGEGEIVIEETFKITNSDPISSAEEGDETDEASVSAEFTYSMVGLDQADLEQVLEATQSEQIDTDALSILDNGADQATLSVEKKESATRYTVNVSTDGYVGPEINVEALAEEITGKRFSEVVEIIRSKPGVADVEVGFSPFWVFTAPGPEKTTITINVTDE